MLLGGGRVIPDDVVYLRTRTAPGRYEDKELVPIAHRIAGLVELWSQTKRVPVTLKDGARIFITHPPRMQRIVPAHSIVWSDARGRFEVR